MATRKQVTAAAQASQIVGDWLNNDETYSSDDAAQIDNVDIFFAADQIILHVQKIQEDIVDQPAPVSLNDNDDIVNEDAGTSKQKPNKVLLTTYLYSLAQKPP